jgi:hypothetical protein
MKIISTKEYKRLEQENEYLKHSITEIKESWDGYLIGEVAIKIKKLFNDIQT